MKKIAKINIHPLCHNLVVKSLFLFSIVGLFGGCACLKTPPTPGEQARQLSYGYTPIDPLPAGVAPTNSTTEQILKALPDETIRLAVGSVSGNLQVTYGPAMIGYQGSNYVVTVDYIKYNTKSIGLMKDPTGGYRLAGPNSTPEVVVPVYVGIGLRLTANLRVNQGNVNLGSLIAIGAAAEAHQITGSLVIQTLGISGTAVSLSIPTVLNETTIQNALMNLGAIKGTIYTSASIIPRVVGFYNNIAGDETIVNSVISLLLSNPITLDTTLGNGKPL